MEERSQSSDDDRSPNYYQGEGSPNYDQSSDGEESQGAADEEERSYDYKDGYYNSDERQHKRLKSEETLKQDRISAMPDVILLHILSFLPTKDAVKTGTLSQRWLYLWTCVPNLDFTSSSYLPDDISRLATFVDKTLILHKCCNVKKFTVDFHYYHSDDDFLPSRVDMWIRFATRANVEELCINLKERHYTMPNNNYYKLPHHVYNNSSMRKLSLSGCDVVPDGLICWKSLKRFSIGYSKLSEDLIQKILAGSPSLEFLELCGFYKLNRLNIGSVSLRELVITDRWQEDSDDESELEISAPNLRSLGIMGTMYGKKFRLMDVRSLVDCKLAFKVYAIHNDTDYEVHKNMFRGILDRLRHVKKLTMGNWCLQMMATLAMKVPFFPPSKRECLVIETHIEVCDIHGIAGLLQSSYNLETLVLNFLNHSTRTVLCYGEVWPPIDHWTLQEWRSKCSLKCLKTIEIVGFVERHLGFEHVIQLVQFLLESARVLEKMVIKARKVDHNGLECSPKGLLKVAQRLLSLPRSSPHAVVLFSE